MPMIIDTHAHFHDITDPAAVLRDSAAGGVSDIVLPGVDLRSNQCHVRLRADYALPRLHVAMGLHPAYVPDESAEACFSFMREHLSDAVAVGETGLDFGYKWVRDNEAGKNEQRAAFSRHLELARTFDLPVIVHSRGAWRECLDMVKAAGIRRADFHWYSGPEDVLRDLLDAGFVISCSVAVEHSIDVRRAVVFAPLGSILVETDTPAKIPSANGERIPSAPRDVWRTMRAL
ncbi:MAG: TatD family hydrolase, partial [Candidatus Omnitrophota bacterium]